MLTRGPVLEATEFAYGQRSTLGDPAFTKNVTYLEQAYLSESTVTAIRAKINDTKTYPVSYYDPGQYFPSRESGTSHMAIIDGDGMAVSLTTTVNLIWGSRVSEYEVEVVLCCADRRSDRGWNHTKRRNGRLWCARTTQRFWIPFVTHQLPCCWETTTIVDRIVDG